MITAIDLFCGAGGATSGMIKSGVHVVAAINHDPLAIESHQANHPETDHYNEDVRSFNVDLLPKKVNIIWMSAECTHLSNAKGGLPRDADSRTLSEELPRYVRACDPDYIYVENVKEFLSWGPLDEKGRPVRKKNGKDYVQWVNSVTELGYSYDFRILNSANFGAYTSRERYFGIFSRKGLPVRWPQETHSKTISGNGMFAPAKKKWKAVKDVLSLDNFGASIFTGRRNRPLLSPNTLARIEYGLNKFSKDPNSTHLISGSYNHKPISIFRPINTIMASRRHWYMINMIDRYSFRNPPTSVNDPISTVMAHRDQYFTSAFLTLNYGNNGVANMGNVQGITQPLRTISTRDRFQCTRVNYMIKQFSQAQAVSSIDMPAPTIMTRPGGQMINAFISYYYGGGKGNSNSRVGWLSNPINVIATSHTPALIQTKFLSGYYSNGGNASSLNHPFPSILTKPKQRLISSFFDISYQNKYNVGSIDAPISTILTNPKHNIITLIHDSYQVKSTPFVVELNKSLIEIPGTRIVPVKIKNVWTPGYRVSSSIQDIFMRMLNVPELMAAQGFPEGYILKGSTTHQKKFIGNSVVPLMAELLTSSNISPLLMKQAI